MKGSFVARTLIATAIFAGSAPIATPAMAAVTFDTSGSVLSCNTNASCAPAGPNSITFGGITLTYNIGTNVAIDPTSFVNLGSLQASGSGSFDLLGATLLIHINQIAPPGSGNLPGGDIVGTITGNSSGATISWSTAGVEIGDYLYTVANNPLAINSPASCIAGTTPLVCGFTSIQGQVAVPEPATWAMMLLGFAGIGAAMRRTRKRALTQLA